MDQQQQLAELKAKLARLKGEEAEAPAEQETAPADAEERDRVMIRRIFADMLGWDGIEDRKRREREDAAMSVCATCYLLQAKGNARCTLCGGSAGWLAPSSVRSNEETAMFLRMADGHTVEQLRIALQSGWAKTKQREAVARLLLSSREAKLKPQPVLEPTPATSSQPAPVEAQQIDFDGLLRRYDRQMEQISKEQSTASGR